MAPFRKKPHLLHPTEAREEWTVVEGEYEGKPLVARCNVGLRSAAGHPDYGIQIGIAVPFNHPTEDGFPPPEETEALSLVEGQVERLTDGKAVLAGVITCKGMREFVLYTGSTVWIEGFDRALQTAVDSHEVQVMAQDDKDWNVYRSLLE